MKKIAALILAMVMMLALGNGIKSYFSNMIDSFMNPLVVEVSMEQATIDPNDPMSAMTAIGMKEPFKEEMILLEDQMHVDIDPQAICILVGR